MIHFSNIKNIFVTLLITIMFTTLTACKDKTNNDAYIQVSIAGNNTQTKPTQNTPAYAQDNVNVLPDNITRVEFKIIDSDNIVTTASLPVGPETQTISLRVKPNSDLIIEIEALTGNTVSFRGQTSVAALRPGQSFPLSVSLDEIGAPPTNAITLNLSQTGNSQIEGDNGTSSITFTATLSELADGDVTADYSTNGLSASTETDFEYTSGTITILTGTLSANITVTIFGDTEPEEDEVFLLSLSNVSANVVLGDASANGAIISDDYPGRLNDTGVSLCTDFSSSQKTDNNNIDCQATGSSATVTGTELDGDPVPAGQDAHYGRDAAYNVDSNGHAGFDFTKLDANGEPLADQSLDYATQPWDCVRDNYTGLTWEVKTTSGFRSNVWTYSWFNSTGINDGGTTGTANGGVCSTIGSGCDTERYVSDMNEMALCGLTNWRLPDISELLNIVDNSRVDPAIDINFFPNTLNAYTWSSTPVSNPLYITFARSINFYMGATISRGKSQRQPVRLVSPATPAPPAPILF